MRCSRTPAPALWKWPQCSLGFNRVSIVGHDIGLMVAYAYAAQFPQGTELEWIELAPPCVNPIEPRGGWKATAVAKTDDVALTVLKALDLENELPPAAPPTLAVQPPRASPTAPPAPVRDVAVRPTPVESPKENVQEQRALRLKLQKWIVERIVTGMGTPGELKRDDQTIALIHERFLATWQVAGVNLSPADLQALEADVLDELLGLGPLEPLLRDPSITEVMVNGPYQVYVERSGLLEEADVVFEDEDHVKRIIDRIIAPLGRRCDESSPMVDARLTDGSRVNAIIPPLSLIGPVITIRKFAASPFTVDDLVRFGTATPDMFEFLRACVEARLNIFVSGGTGSGKTTMLNILSSFIPDDERIVTIEDAAELQLHQEHVLRLESRPANIEGKGQVTIRDLVRNSLRMRPDRIIVGEVRGGEALDMLQAMNTGHEGSMTTIHANTCRDALARLESMVAMASLNLPERAVRQQIAAGIGIIVQISRLSDGSRRVTNIAEITGMDEDVVSMQDIFTFTRKGIGADGRMVGLFQPSRIRPRFLERLRVCGIILPQETFERPMEVN